MNKQLMIILALCFTTMNNIAAWGYTNKVENKSGYPLIFEARYLGLPGNVRKSVSGYGEADVSKNIACIDKILIYDPSNIIPFYTHSIGGNKCSSHKFVIYRTENAQPARAVPSQKGTPLGKTGLYVTPNPSAGYVPPQIRVEW